MTAPAEYFEEIDPYEGFDGLELAEEGMRFPFIPGRRIFAPGGLSSATLNTPKGPARLSLPSPVPTLAQYRTLEQTVNSLTQRLNATNTQLLQVRREQAVRARDQGGMGMSGMLLALLSTRKLREGLEEHTHGSGPAATIPDGDSKLDALLPILLLQPNLFGGSSSGQGGTGSQDAMSPLMMILMLQLFD